MAKCERCNGRGVIETGEIVMAIGGYGFVTEPCGCEERQAFRDAAEEAGWLVEMVTFGDEYPTATLSAMAGTYSFGPAIRREQVPPGAVYEHSGAPGSLWLNDEPHLMTPDPSDPSETAATFRVATLHEDPTNGN